MIENKKDKLLKLSLRELRKEAKKCSVPLYSRKTKALLVDLILKYQKKVLLQEKTNDQEKLSDDVQDIELSEDIKDIELFEDVKDKEFSEDENCKINSKVFKNRISDKNSNLKKLLSESFPDKKISVIDNKDGSQTILII